ncbi:hypothetical protein PIB30_061172 [Stylosanthes scabra]|uniref:Uncharacterized protein n=1 Tax=Stylosanthes scabra TaxID=79078 RepID=A0ABU6QK78_9FABA|nr:hypothetical protein [Stylosanthes scabra]
MLPPKVLLMLSVSHSIQPQYSAEDELEGGARAINSIEEVMNLTNETECWILAIIVFLEGGVNNWCYLSCHSYALLYSSNFKTNAQETVCCLSNPPQSNFEDGVGIPVKAVERDLIPSAQVTSICTPDVQGSSSRTFHHSGGKRKSD